MTKNKVARQQWKAYRAKLYTNVKAFTSLTDYERGTLYAAVLIGLSFGLMFFWGLR